MKRKLFIITMACSNAAMIPSALLSQGIHFNNGGKIRISNSASVVINNPSPTGLRTTGTGNAVYSEGESNRIKWKTGSGTGSFCIPFRTNSGTDIPVTFEITAAGTESSAGCFSISTYPTNPTNISYPTDVTHMNGISGDMSLYAVDRFWIIDATGYSIKPDISLTLTYDVTELSNPNTINEGMIRGQRFNNSISSWTDVNPAGSANTTSKTVSGISINGTNLFRSLTLVDNTVLLPVTLIDFYYKCHETSLEVSWITASEVNNDKFILEKAANEAALVWEPAGEINGNGTSVQHKHYTFADHHPELNIYYYRLKQVDYNGRINVCGIIEVHCDHIAAGKIDVVYHPSGIMLQVDMDCETEFLVSIYDLLGRLIWFEPKIIYKNNNQIFVDRRKFRPGYYTVTFKNSFQSLSTEFEIF